MLDGTVPRSGSAEDPLWLKLAIAELGVAEIPGDGDNPRILHYHSYTDGPGGEDDETNWCSSFINYCTAEAGHPGTRSKAARSWLKWGFPLQQPRRGAITVIWRVNRTSWQGHVALLDHIGHIDGKAKVFLWGGNQGNRVSLAPFDLERVLGYRWPTPIL
jgi:uncharacterized protein (TIGR02594 family)